MTIRTLLPFLFAAGAGRGFRGWARSGSGCRMVPGPPPGDLTALALILLFAACGDHPSRTADQPSAHWVSEPEYHFGDALAGDALFGFIPSVRVSPDGQRVFVLEPYESRVSVWTPHGRLLFEVGGAGEGPGDFMLPYRIHLDDSWFYVRDQSRFTYFAYDRKILRTVPNPPTSVSYEGRHIRVNARLADGSFVGMPGNAPPVSPECVDPRDEVPVLRVRQTGAGWIHEPVFRLVSRNGTLLIAHRGCLYAPQPYPDSDLYLEDPSASTVVVVRRSLENPGPGQAELFELSVAGDTIWKRRLAFRPIRLTRDMLEATVDELRSIWENRYPRDVVERAVFAPEYLPSVSDFALTSSGRIWLRSYETQDTLSVWYSLERGSDESPPRRVALPDWFRVMDATATHVWGVWKDELDITYVVGRRLVPAS